MKKLMALVIAASLVASPFALAHGKCGCKHKKHHHHHHMQKQPKKQADASKNDVQIGNEAQPTT